MAYNGLASFISSNGDDSNVNKTSNSNNNSNNKHHHHHHHQHREQQDQEPVNVLCPEKMALTQLLSTSAMRHFQGKQYRSAIEEMHKVLQIFHENEATLCNDYARCLNNLAFMLKSLKDHEGARCLYERALVVRIKLFGEYHPDVAVSLHNLCALMLATGKLQEALPFHEKVVKIRKMVFGNGSASHVQSLHDLGLCLEALKQPQMAIPVYEEALTLLNQRCPDGCSPDSMKCLQRLSICLQLIGEDDLANVFKQQAEELRRKLEADKVGRNGVDAFATIATLHTLVGRADLGVPIFLRAHHLLNQGKGPVNAPVVMGAPRPDGVENVGNNRVTKVDDDDRKKHEDLNNNNHNLVLDVPRLEATLVDTSEPQTPVGAYQWRKDAPEGLYERVWEAYLTEHDDIEGDTTNNTSSSNSSSNINVDDENDDENDEFFEAEEFFEEEN